MQFQSAQCPNCDSLMKIDSESENVFCAACGIQLPARDAFVYFQLKNGGETDIENVANASLLLKCGVDFLDQKKHDLADACFANVLNQNPDDYQAWKLRAAAWESRVVNEFRESFYEYSRTGGLKENKDYVGKYREFCDNAVRCCPADMAGDLADEFNDHIRGHFNVAHQAYRTEKRKSAMFKVLAVLSMFSLAALAIGSCRV